VIPDIRESTDVFNDVEQTDMLMDPSLSFEEML
jgi:hypothetical protein